MFHVCQTKNVSEEYAEWCVIAMMHVAMAKFVTIEFVNSDVETIMLVRVYKLALTDNVKVK